MEIVKKVKKILLKNRLLIAAFFLPALIITGAFATMGVYPFGDQQAAVIDFYHQYLPLIEELQYKLQHGQSLFYTWNGFGGYNFWNVIAYQAASPLNIFIVLFPAEHLVDILTLLIVIRVGLAGSFMFIFLRGMYEKANFATVGFATLYALCAYVVAYYWNIMWLDAVMLLPLCILGLRRLVDGGKPVLYVITLAIIVFSNYYIAILVCIFIITYYFVIYFEKRRGNFKAFLKTSVRVLLYSILALGMTAVMLLPTWISMKDASAMASTFPEERFFYDDPLDVINQLLPFGKFSYMEGLPNIGCGLVVVILLVFYFIDHMIPLRRKVANGIYLGFLFVSLNFNILDFIWHGLHYPNMLPYRYAFAVSFLLIAMAYEAFCRIDWVKIKHLWIVLAAGLGYYVICQKLLKTVVDDMNTYFYGGVVLLLLYMCVFIIYRKNIITSRAFRYLFVVVVAAEMICTSITGIHTIGTSDRGEYNENGEDVRKAAAYIDGEFARSEIDSEITLNDPGRFHYKGLTQFASSMNCKTNGLMEAIGLEAAPMGNRCKYVLTCPVVNSMLNVKYIIARNRPLEREGFTLVKQFGNTRVYENSQPLSIGYMAPNSIRTWNRDSDNPFENLDDYVRAASGNRYYGLFTEIRPVGQKCISGKLTTEGKNSYKIIQETTGVAGGFNLEYLADKTREYYIYVDGDCTDYITLRREDDKKSISIDENYAGIVNIGKVKAGEKFTLEIDFEPGRSGTAKCYAYWMDEERWNKAYDVISANMMDVVDYSSDHVKGKIDVDQDGVLVTSIPYDRGWEMKVDGQKKEITDLTGGVWISTALAKGDHTIELSFKPPGFVVGLVITVLSILLFACISIFGQRIRASVFPERDEAVDDFDDLP